MQRMVSLAVGLGFAVVSAGCAGGAANPVSPSALIDSGVTAGSATSATQARTGGGGGSKPPKGSSGGGTLAYRLVNDVGGDGVVNRGDSVTFDITTTVTTQPYVELMCRQNGTVVYSKTAGYFDGYQWPWSQVMVLSSDFWTGGDASCTAELYYNNRLTRTSLTTISFTAYE